jgi:hypothetical protein
VIAASWSDLLDALLPFVILMAFWLLLMRRVRGTVPPGQQEILERLTEIRDELRRLRQSVESSDLSRR